MKNEIKTMDGWYSFGEKNQISSWDDYAKPGDIVGKDVYEYFLNILPPLNMSRGYLQVGEPHEYRLNPVTGAIQSTYATFTRNIDDTWRYCGNCFAEDIYDAESMAAVKSLQDFMKATCFLYAGLQVVRPRIVCNDGFSISVQDGSGHYCTPRENLQNGEYTSFEIGFISREEKILKPYAEEQKHYTEQVYCYVPADIAEQVIEKHGGIKGFYSSTFIFR